MSDLNIEKFNFILTRSYFQNDGCMTDGKIFVGIEIALTKNIVEVVI